MKTKKILATGVVCVMAAFFAMVPTQAKEKKLQKSYTITQGREDMIYFDTAKEEEYTYKIANKKVVKDMEQGNSNIVNSKDVSCITLKGIKVGKTTVKIYDGKKKIGQFKVKVVKKGKAKITPKAQVKLRYFNRDGFKTSVISSSLSLSDLVDQCVDNFNPKAKYSFKISNKKILYSKYKDLHANKIGSSKITLYEKYKGKKVKVGTVKVKVSNATYKDYLYTRADFYDDGFFGYGEKYEHLDLTKNKKIVVKSDIEKRFMEGINTKNYSISLTSSDEKVAKFNEDGDLVAVGLGECDFTWKVTAKDGSTWSEKITVGVTKDAN